MSMLVIISIKAWAGGCLGKPEWHASWRAERPRRFRCLTRAREYLAPLQAGRDMRLRRQISQSWSVTLRMALAAL